QALKCFAKWVCKSTKRFCQRPTSGSNRSRCLFDYVRRHRELADIENRMAQPGFWDDPERAQKVVQEKKLCFQVVDPIDRFSQVIEDGMVLLELGADDPAGVEADLLAARATLDEGLDALEFQLM